MHSLQLAKAVKEKPKGPACGIAQLTQGSVLCNFTAAIWWRGGGLGGPSLGPTCLLQHVGHEDM